MIAAIVSSATRPIKVRCEANKIDLAPAGNIVVYVILVGVVDDMTALANFELLMMTQCCTFHFGQSHFLPISP